MGQSAGHVPHVQPGQVPPKWWLCGTGIQGQQLTCQGGTHTQVSIAPGIAPNALGKTTGVVTNVVTQRGSGP